MAVELALKKALMPRHTLQLLSENTPKQPGHARPPAPPRPLVAVELALKKALMPRHTLQLLSENTPKQPGHARPPAPPTPPSGSGASPSKKPSCPGTHCNSYLKVHLKQPGHARPPAPPRPLVAVELALKKALMPRHTLQLLSESTPKQPGHARPPAPPRPLVAVELALKKALMPRHTLQLLAESTPKQPGHAASARTPTPPSGSGASPQKSPHAQAHTATPS